MICHFSIVIHYFFSELNSDTRHTYQLPLTRKKPVMSEMAPCRIYKCDYCDAVLSSEVTYQRHISHNHSQLLPFPCATCSRGFFTKSGLQRHMKADHEERKFICVICDASFKAKYNLKVHLKKLHKLTPCNNCSEMFSTAEEFNRHALTCSGFQQFMD